MKLVPHALRATAAAVFCTLVVGCSLFKERAQQPRTPAAAPAGPGRSTSDGDSTL